MNKVSKLIGAVIGGLTPATLVGVLALFHLTIPADLLAPILTLATVALGAAGVYVAPRNSGTDTAVTVPVYVQPATEERQTIPVPESVPPTTPAVPPVAPEAQVTLPTPA